MTIPNEASSLQFPVNTKEDITTFAHYYRGEIMRVMSWRDRIDRTTHWAIGAMAAMLSVLLASPNSHHGVVLVAMAVTYLLLHIEARRYRFYDVFRVRIRLLECNYYSTFFDPKANLVHEDWAAAVGKSLSNPKFNMTRLQAMARRLQRNYRWIFILLLIVWLLKITSMLSSSYGDTELVGSFTAFLSNANIGYIPGWIALAGVMALYGWLLYVMTWHRNVEEESGFGEVHF
jgi:uncharacterized membrane protein